MQQEGMSIPYWLYILIERAKRKRVFTNPLKTQRKRERKSVVSVG